MVHKLFKQILYIANIALILALSFTAASATPYVVTNYEDYKVSGNDLEQIRKSIIENGLKSDKGHSFAAKTNYKIWWNPHFKVNEYGCAVESVDVLVSVTYKMPVLINARALSLSDRNAWRKYYKALKFHEEGHAKFGLWAAEEIEWEIANMLPKKDCKKMQSAVNELGIEILHKYHNENVAYDYATNHGHDQGAKL